MEIIKLPQAKLRNFYQNGFTLIEILVVVFIIGVMVSVVTVRIGGGDSRVLVLEAKRLMHVINEVQDLSVLSGKAYALTFNESDGSYAFMHNPPDWSYVEGNKLLKSRNFPESITFNVDVDKIDNSADEIVNDDSPEEFDLGTTEITEEDEVKEPIVVIDNQVLISPVGEMTAFTLTLISDDLRLQVFLNDEQKLEAKRL